MDAPPGPISCPVCRAETGDILALCEACETPHHPECWEFAHGCAVFACGQERARLVPKADLLRPAAPGEPLVLEVEREPLVEEIQFEEPEPPPLRHRESDAVMFVSWVYLAGSLILAIPALGYLMRGLATASPLPLVHAAGCAAAATGLKHLGDLLAVGDGRGRSIHLYACFGLALLSVSLCATLIVGALVVPFWTRRGRQHFARWLRRR